MPDRLARMRQCKHPQVLCRLYQRRQHCAVAEAIPLTMRHQLAKAWHTSGKAAFQLGDSTCPCKGLDRCKANDTPRIVTHYLDDVAVALLRQPRVVPAK